MSQFLNAFRSPKNQDNGSQTESSAGKSGGAISGRGEPGKKQVKEFRLFPKESVDTIVPLLTEWNDPYLQKEQQVQNRALPVVLNSAV